MFTLDINFLDDDSRKGAEAFAPEAKPLADSQFILIGGGVALVSILLAGIIWYFVDQTIQRQNAQIAELTGQETALDNKLKELAAVEGSIKKIEDQTTVLVNLFVGDIPLSAILSEIRTRSIANVKVKEITQDGKVLKLLGQARNFDDVSDLALLLKGSSLVEPDGVRVVSVTQEPEDKETKIALVSFEVAVPLTTKSLIAIIPELEQAGATGTVARIRLLQEQEVLPK
ncbi:MAG: PilN domain-containing protein [Pseudanabaenaceae cyanobacterium bins.68]|nr:PilN domain-containing protein [Pseudanabaenaceae cyanobacterium bins.68]